jgi:hypothetical protein
MLTPDAERAVAVITALGGRPLLVGGSVRDRLLGIESKDIDIEVHGPVSWLQLTEALAEHGRVDTVGAAFGVIKFGRDVDISFPRRDSKTGSGHTGFMIDVDPTMTVEEALSRRDFTMNSMAMDLNTNKLIDPFGGVSDLMQGIIRHTSDAFVEDPLRILRAVQFAARFSMTIAPETAKLCRSIVKSFDQISIERVWIEWEKILTKGKSPTHLHMALMDTGLKGHCFAGLPSPGPLATWAFDRSVGLPAEEMMAIRLAVLFVPKPDELPWFLKRIDAPLKVRRNAKVLVQKAPVGEDAFFQTRLIARLIAPMSLDSWFIVHGFSDYSELYFAAVDQGILYRPKPPLLTGDDLKAWGLMPGPVFGKILREALSTQDLRGWKVKEQAIEWLGGYTQ